ncbi:hypothetical protein L195_g039515, partial [Trifolium pratense]
VAGEAMEGGSSNNTAAGFGSGVGAARRLRGARGLGLQGLDICEHLVSARRAVSMAQGTIVLLSWLGVSGREYILLLLHLLQP